MDTLPATLAEGTEAEVMYQFVSMAPPSIKSRLQIATTRIGGGVALSVRNDATGFWSKALGFGFAEPITHDLIGRVVDFYRAQDSKGAVFQIAPSVLPPNWNEISAEYGLRPDSYWVKLAAPVEDFWAGRSTLSVSPVDPGNVRDWATVTFRGFGMPEDGFTEMVAGSVANPDVRPFAAWDGDTMVATGTLFVRGEIGSLNAGATLPSHRNQGAQSALLAARAEAAAKAGCRWLIAETGLPAKGGSNPSLNNLLRAGFRPLYSRRNWNWQPDAA
ncbi:GNAT family N-acetyltransferase [Streptosporangium sp. G11]|uniref:GNAT family N-acetyltransferase n=1 Tax=Streptosporangium sp. G11 TaxID=3436926 RepID=UPI003EC0C4A6